MRIILYTGKGGVGKTSIAAATAVKSAAQGKKTLVVNRKTDNLGRFNGLPCRFAGCRDDEIGQRPSLYLSGAFQHRMDMDGQAGFKTGGL